jgi:site-specific DNA-methyltransferase (adenine-specific)
MDKYLDKIIRADCIEGMKYLPKGRIDLAFADPPFNIGYEYDVYKDNMNADQYVAWSREWISQMYRVLKADGTFWLAIGDDFAAELKIESQKIGFHCRSWVVWYYTFGVNCMQKFTRSHTHLFHFVKDLKNFTFRFDELENRVPSARQLVYNDSRGNPDGRLPDDTWIIPPADQTWTLRPQDLQGGFQSDQDTWYYPRVAGTFKERAGFHGCQMPEQLLGRIIRICSNENDLVLDPFSGSSTTLAVAKKLGRRYTGFEISKDYVKLGRRRLDSIKAGDRLDGADEPLMSAPKTKKKRKKHSRKRKAGKKSKSQKKRKPLTK